MTTIAPKTLARIGGVLYLIIILGGVFNEAFIRDRLIVWGDPSATAAGIRASEGLWRLGAGIELFMLMCSVVLAIILYHLIRPVSREGALLATAFNLVSIALEAANELRLFAALFPLGSAEYLRTLDPALLETLASLSLREYGYGFGAALLFFGCFCLVFGELVRRSAYIPPLIGILMIAAGVSYLVNSFALLLSPPLSEILFPLILLPALIGEAALCLWLLFRFHSFPIME